MAVDLKKLSDKDLEKQVSKSLKIKSAYRKFVVLAVVMAIWDMIRSI